jgi:hypothetical protein
LQQGKDHRIRSGPFHPDSVAGFCQSSRTWTDDSNCGVEDRACQLTICGVQGDVPLELKLRLASAPTDERNRGIVCIAGNTTAVIEVSMKLLSRCD